MAPKLHIRLRIKVLIACALLALVLCVLCLLLLPSVKFSIPNPLKIPRDNTAQSDNSHAAFRIPTPTPDIKVESADNFSINYDVTPAAQAKGTVRIPVLTYHHTAPLPNNMQTRDYYVSPTIMDQQIAYLAAKGYRSITPQEFYDQLATGQNPKQKLVMITFDDGNEDNYTNAFPILKKYGMIGVFYVPSNKHGITNTQLKEMSAAGMVIDPHGKTHMLLSKVTDSTVLNDEIVNSKINIQNLTGKKVTSFCYPGCEYNGTVVSTIRNNGYLLAFSCGKSIDHRLSSRYTLSRMHVYNDLNHFKSILSGVSYYPAPYSD